MYFTTKLGLYMALLCGMAGAASAQSTDSVYDKYTDFNLERFQGSTDRAMQMGIDLLPQADKLPPKSRIAFYNSMAKVYEDHNLPDKALPLYEKVAAAEPDYYVAHLALGHIYLRDVNALAQKVNAAKGDKAAYDKTMKAYIAAINKVLPHLEKVQACDPYDDNLALIKKLYSMSNNPAGLAGLDARVKQMSQKCLDILNDN